MNRWRAGNNTVSQVHLHMSITAKNGARAFCGKIRIWEGTKKFFLLSLYAFVQGWERELACLQDCRDKGRLWPAAGSQHLAGTSSNGGYSSVPRYRFSQLHSTSKTRVIKFLVIRLNGERPRPIYRTPPLQRPHPL